MVAPVPACSYAAAQVRNRRSFSSITGGGATSRARLCWVHFEVGRNALGLLGLVRIPFCWGLVLVQASAASMLCTCDARKGSSLIHRAWVTIMSDVSAGQGTLPFKCSVEAKQLGRSFRKEDSLQNATLAAIRIMLLAVVGLVFLLSDNPKAKSLKTPH